MRARPELRAGTRAITSPQNERVKLIRALEMRKVRRETGLFVAEGTSLMLTARAAGWLPKILVFLVGSREKPGLAELARWAEAALLAAQRGVARKFSPGSKAAPSLKEAAARKHPRRRKAGARRGRIVRG